MSSPSSFVLACHVHFDQVFFHKPDGLMADGQSVQNIIYGKVALAIYKIPVEQAAKRMIRRDVDIPYSIKDGFVIL